MSYNLLGIYINSSSTCTSNSLLSGCGSPAPPVVLQSPVTCRKMYPTLCNVVYSFFSIWLLNTVTYLSISLFCSDINYSFLHFSARLSYVLQSYLFTALLSYFPLLQSTSTPCYLLHITPHCSSLPPPFHFCCRASHLSLTRTSLGENIEIVLSLIGYTVE